MKRLPAISPPLERGLRTRTGQGYRRSCAGAGLSPVRQVREYRRIPAEVRGVSWAAQDRDRDGRPDPAVRKRTRTEDAGPGGAVRTSGVLHSVPYN